MKLEQLLLIVGLSASGKRKRLAAALQEWLHAYPQVGHCQDWAGWNNKSAKDELFAHLAAGGAAIIDCAGFCLPNTLDPFLAELKQNLSSVTVRVEYFDNNPLCSMRLALHDPTRPYGDSGCLARVAQIARDCGTYAIDPNSTNVHLVYPSQGLVRYTPRQEPWYDEQLAKIRSLLSSNGHPLTGDHFRVMPIEAQDALIASVGPVVEAAVTKLLGLQNLKADDAPSG